MSSVFDVMNQHGFNRRHEAGVLGDFFLRGKDQNVLRVIHHVAITVIMFYN